MKYKVLDLLLLLAFLGILITVGGMMIGGETKHFFKEIHEIIGMTFILLILGHIFMHRKVIKAMLSSKIEKRKE